MARRSVILCVTLAAVTQAVGTGCYWRPCAWRCGGGCWPHCFTPPGAVGVGGYAGPAFDAAPVSGGPGCSSCFASPAVGAPVSVYGPPAGPVAYSGPIAYSGPVQGAPPVMHGPPTVVPPSSMGNPLPMPSPVPAGTK